MKLTRLTCPPCDLGESPVWDPQEQAFYWVDGLAPAVFRMDWRTGDIARRDLPEIVGSICRAAGGGLTLAFPDRIATGRFDGELEDWRHVEDIGAGLRFNDSKSDPAGRLVAGTMDLQENAPIGTAYGIGPDGAKKLVAQGFTVFNGPCWSRDGRQMHLSDSASRTVWSFDYDPQDGTARNQAVFLSLDQADGLPDGATFDDADLYWQARNGAGKLSVHDLDGALRTEIPMPTANVTSLAFGGPEMNALLVTSMNRRLPWQDSLDDAAGGVFLIEDIGSKGRIEPVVELGSALCEGAGR